MEYLRELFTRVLAGDSVSTILQGLEPAKKGHVGEGLLRLLVLLGIHPTDPSSTVIPYQTDPDNRRIESIATFAERLDLLKSGKTNSGGSDKIDVSWRHGANIYVCSSKIGKLQIKSIADLEIPIMLSEFTESGGLKEKGKLVPRDSVIAYALVNNKAEVFLLAEKSKASNKVSKDNLNVLDVEDLNRMCSVLLERLALCPSKDMETVLGFLMKDEKPSLRTRFHQKLLCNKMMKLIRSGEKTILLGALPRSGKTWMGAFVAKHFQKVLIITTRPGETRSQWNKVFKLHREFSDYKVSDLHSATSQEIAAANKRGDKVIAIASSQFMKGDEDKHTRKCLQGLEWDLVLLDEVHEGGSTELSNLMLETYIGTKSIRLLMTATYTKPVEYFMIPNECCCFWDLEDIRLMRTWPNKDVLQRLCEKYGKDDVTKAQEDTYRSGETDKSIRLCYTNAPKLGILTTVMQQDIYEDLRSITESPDNIYGFSMRSLFMPTKDGKAFQHQGKIDDFLACISGSDYMTRYGNQGNMSMFARILRYWKMTGHRDSDEFMTQIWFLPSGVGQLLEHVKPLLISRIQANKVLKNFATLTLDAGMGDISKAVSSAVMDAKEQGKKGLILLTGNVGSLGVSLPEVDVAFMLHDIESADMNYQQMMRVLTEMMNKKYGLVVDFNVWRVLTTLNTYATSRCGQGDKSSAERIHWCVSHLVDVDADLWDCDESPQQIPQEKILLALTNQWRRMLEQTGTSLNRLARKQIDLGEDQVELDEIAKHLEGGLGKEKLQVNEDQEKLPSGIEERSTGSGEEEEQEEEEEEEEIEKKANLNDVLARLIPELAMLSGCKQDLLQAVRTIHSNPQQREALNEFLTQLYA